MFVEVAGYLDVFGKPFELPAGGPTELFERLERRGIARLHPDDPGAALHSCNL